MRTVHRTPALVALALVIASCTSAHLPAVSPGEQFELGVGGAVRADAPASIVRIAAIADSRCPVDVTCISAGEAVVAVDVGDGGTTRRDTLRLLAGPRSVALGTGRRLELLDVRPVPHRDDRERVSTAVLRLAAAP